MILRERNHDERENQPRPVASIDPVDLRERAERLLAHGDDAIDRTLSQDSAAFLAANLQEGGQ